MPLGGGRAQRHARLVAMLSSDQVAAIDEPRSGAAADAPELLDEILERFSGAGAGRGGSPGRCRAAAAVLRSRPCWPRTRAESNCAGSGAGRLGAAQMTMTRVVPSSSRRRSGDSPGVGDRRRDDVHLPQRAGCRRGQRERRQAGDDASVGTERGFSWRTSMARAAATASPSGSTSTPWTRSPPCKWCPPTRQRAAAARLYPARRVRAISAECRRTGLTGETGPDRRGRANWEPPGGASFAGHGRR